MSKLFVPVGVSSGEMVTETFEPKDSVEVRFTVPTLAGQDLQVPPVAVTPVALKPQPIKAARRKAGELDKYRSKFQAAWKASKQTYPDFCTLLDRAGVPTPKIWKHRTWTEAYQDANYGSAIRSYKKRLA